jgi:hypothetical protein
MIEASQLPPLSGSRRRTADGVNKRLVEYDVVLVSSSA